MKARGIVLAIVSKNDSEKIDQVWPHIWQGRLTLDDFAVREINWKSKAENVAAVMQQVNVRPDSVVFIDDSPVERAAVHAAFPEIRVLGREPFALRRILLDAPETQVPIIAAESARRTQMVQSQVARESTRARMSRDEFLASLNVSVETFQVRSTTDERFARCIELINKTNQFNTTGRRLTVEACERAFAGGTVFWAFHVSDRFVDYGIVGVVVVNGTDLEQFVMSCRVLGLDVEQRMVAQIVSDLVTGGAEFVSARVIPTKANQLCLDVYRRCGFKQTGDVWLYPAAGLAGSERTFVDAETPERIQVVCNKDQ